MTRHHRLGARPALSASLAALLVVELILDGKIARADENGFAVVDRPVSPNLLVTAARIVDDHGSNLATVLASMDRGLARCTGVGTWDAVIEALTRSGVVVAQDWGARVPYEVVDTAARDAVVRRLRLAVDNAADLDRRSLALLWMADACLLLDVVEPTRAGRQRARTRIETCRRHQPKSDTDRLIVGVLGEAAARAARGFGRTPATRAAIMTWLQRRRQRRTARNDHPEGSVERRGDASECDEHPIR